MNRLSLYFTSPRQVIALEEALPEPPADQVLVQTLASAISPGTEALIYRGLFPEELPVDENIAALPGRFEYPLKYGYSAVGRVIAAGSQVDHSWEDRLVSAFNPHESHFLAKPKDLLPLPDDISPEDALFLPNMETAVSLAMDGQPKIGERAVVFGQGIIGLLTTAILSQFPLETLVTLDCFPLRRQASKELGAHNSLDPQTPESNQELQALLPEGADLTYELSGAPEALNDAIALTGFNGRVLLGSWYGSKRVNLNLGGRFHRSRIRLISSQVSTLDPELSGRWTKARRFEVAWKMLRKSNPSRFITHRFPLTEAAQAYQLIDLHPEETIQVIFTYE